MILVVGTANKNRSSELPPRFFMHVRNRPDIEAALKQITENRTHNLWLSHGMERRAIFSTPAHSLH